MRPGGGQRERPWGRVLNNAFGCRGAPRFAWQAAVRPYQAQCTALNWLQRVIAAKSRGPDPGSDGDFTRFSTPSAPPPLANVPELQYHVCDSATVTIREGCSTGEDRTGGPGDGRSG